MFSNPKGLHCHMFVYFVKKNSQAKSFTKKMLYVMVTLAEGVQKKSAGVQRILCSPLTCCQTVSILARLEDILLLLSCRPQTSPSIFVGGLLGVDQRDVQRQPYRCSWCASNCEL